MAGGEALQRRTGVWWDLNTCPVPAGVDPRRVLPCIESALNKQMGRRSEVHIYAIGNLEFVSSDLLEKISSSGIVLIHAPCGGNDLLTFLREWSRLNNPTPANNVMLISYDTTMVNPDLFRIVGFTAFCAYPKDHRPETLARTGAQKVFVKEFFWETLLYDNTCEMIVNDDDEPLCICDICYDTFEVCGEFISHLQSEEHRKEVYSIAPRDSTGKPKHFCQVCNYPAYHQYNLFLHNESEEHNRKLAEKKTQEEDCESRKRNLQVDPFYEKYKKQCLERGKQDE